ncbi:hypothetical protein EPA93_13770 [Ktedonosporobacter rubrisoli]|uniref:HAMP domain-containing protein n=1 Tax=Ktedonosporobacter rubrisoli TaxID=2509675 RepID=A0A4P6JNY1_KTERU|nr:hypothetical protein [Ktedonosporobacter rubrisoli]QBD77014.1 hypothetical protein EPA93_13770 [Ktedonosporobacter rubrisoli]
MQPIQPLQERLTSQSRHRLPQRSRFDWWFRLTAPAGTLSYETAPTPQAREHLRRSGLTSLIAPFFFIAPLFLLQQAGIDLATAAGILAFMLIVLTALLLNRLNQQVLAALLLICSMDALIEGALLSAKGGLSTGWLLTFDLFIIPLITAGVLLSHRYLWLFLFLHIICILSDFYLLPHTSDLSTLITLWHGPTVAFARPIIIQIGGFLLSFIAARSTDQAITRANQAEALAALQEVVAQEKQQLERGIKEIMAMLANAANGTFTTRTSLPQENILWQVASSLNTLFARLQHTRQAESTLRQTEQETQRLIATLQAAKRGQYVRWPLPSGGPLDALINELRTLPALTTSTASPEMPISVPPRTPDRRPPIG